MLTEGRNQRRGRIKNLEERENGWRKAPDQMGLFWGGRWTREVEGTPPISSGTEEGKAASDTEEANMGGNLRRKKEGL